MSLFKEIVQLDPQNSQAHHALGMSWLRCGRPAEAAASLKRALDLQPGSDPALRSLGRPLAGGSADAGRFASMPQVEPNGR